LKNHLQCNQNDSTSSSAATGEAWSCERREPCCHANSGAPRALDRGRLRGSCIKLGINGTNLKKEKKEHSRNELAYKQLKQMFVWKK
jgi:hypothetical protein